MVAAVAILMLLGQSQMSAPEAAIVDMVKQSSARQIDSALPQVTFDDWLRSIVGAAAPMTWHANDCGEQTGDPAIDRNRDIPMCVEVRVTLEDARELSLSLMVGTWRTGASDVPVFRSGAITTTGGGSRSIDSLAAASKVIAHVPFRTPRFSVQLTFPPDEEFAIASGPDYEGAIVPASSPSHRWFQVGLTRYGGPSAEAIGGVTAWTPASADIALAERYLQTFVVLAAKEPSPVIEELPSAARRLVLAGLPWLATNIQTLKRQYYGIKEDDARRVLVHGFLDHGNDRWRSQVMFLIMGGGCANVWFDVNLDEQRVIRITCGHSG